MIKKETLHPQNEPNIDIYPKTSADQIEELDNTIKAILEELDVYVKQVKEYPDRQNIAYAYCLIFDGLDDIGNIKIKQGIFPLSYNNIKNTVVIRNDNGRVTGGNYYPLTANEFITEFYASQYYLPRNDASNTYLSINEAIANYLTRNDASNTYLSINEAITNYLTKNDASETYLSKNSASEEYLSKTSASEEYLTKSEGSDKYLKKITDITNDSNSQGRIHSANRDGTQDIIPVTMLNNENDGATGNWTVARRDEFGGVRSRLSINDLLPTHCVTKQIGDQLYASKDRALVIPISRPTVESVVTIDTNGAQGITPITNLISGSLYRHTVSRGLSNFTVGNYNVILPDDSYVYSYSVITAEQQYNSLTGYDKLLVQSSDVYLPAKATIINTNSEVSIILYFRLGIIDNNLMCIASVVGSEEEITFSTNIVSTNLFSS